MNETWQRAFDALTTQAARHDLTVKGKTMRYLSMNGNMFAFVDKEGAFCLRLSKDDQAAYRDAHDPREVLQYNSVMRGYVYIDPDLVALGDWFDRCVTNAKDLPAKPTTRKK